ncbi:MAG: hypothetical protein K2X27_14090 [Candidatus Obscuribacterales bacterium]|nr:hypothetical protein [Candidatus Obscuribacterales bacterium]
MNNLKEICNTPSVGRARLGKKSSVEVRKSGLRELICSGSRRPIGDLLLHGALSAISKTKQILQTPLSGKEAHRMCKNYGHSVDPNSWGRNGLPKCEDCGVLIREANQLRRANCIGAEDREIWSVKR